MDIYRQEEGNGTAMLFIVQVLAAMFETSEKLRIVKTANVMAMTIQVINVVLKKLFDLVIV